MKNATAPGNVHLIDDNKPTDGRDVMLYDAVEREWNIGAWSEVDGEFAVGPKSDRKYRREDDLVTLYFSEVTHWAEMPPKPVMKIAKDAFLAAVRTGWLDEGIGYLKGSFDTVTRSPPGVFMCACAIGAAAYTLGVDVSAMCEMLGDNTANIIKASDEAGTKTSALFAIDRLEWL